MRHNIAAYTESGKITRNVVKYVSVNEEGAKLFLSVRDSDGKQVEIEIPPEEMLKLAQQIVGWFIPHG